NRPGLQYPSSGRVTDPLAEPARKSQIANKVAIKGDVALFLFRLKRAGAGSVSNLGFRALSRNTGLRPVQAMFENQGVLHSTETRTGRRPVLRVRAPLIVRSAF